MKQVSDKELDDTLRLFEKYANKEIELSDLNKSVNGDAARILSSRKLIGFDVTEMVSGRVRIRPSSTSPITPLGELRLAEINSP